MMENIQDFDSQYKEIVELILSKGKTKGGPQAIKTSAYFGHQIRIDASGNTPPLLTIRKSDTTAWKNARGELLWFLEGSDDVKVLQEKYGVHIWDLWASDRICDSIGLERGHIGRIYGKQWRNYIGSTGEAIDQISLIERGLKENPENRRHEVTLFDPTIHNYQSKNPFLAPCIRDFHFNSAEGELTLCVRQGSADVALGVPTDVVEYWLLLKMMAQVVNQKPRDLVWTFDDMHIYDNHKDELARIVQLEPMNPGSVSVNPERLSIFDFEMDDFNLQGYKSHPKVKFEPSE